MAAKLASDSRAVSSPGAVQTLWFPGDLAGVDARDRAQALAQRRQYFLDAYRGEARIRWGPVRAGLLAAA